jgi:hypothetical protein
MGIDILLYDDIFDKMADNRGEATVRAPAKLTRKKISTTVSPETLRYLEELIDRGEAYTLAEAIDLLVERLRSAENRERLERDTAAYFDQLSPEAAKEEGSLGAALASSARGTDFDRER